MKKIIPIAVIVVAVAAGVGYYAAHRYAAGQMDAAITEFRASLPPGSSFTYASASPELFSRSGHFTDAVLTINGRTVTAATLDVSPGEGRTLRHLNATKVATKASTAQVSMDRFDVDGLTTPVLATNVADIDPAAVTFDRAAIQGFHSVPDAGGNVDVTTVTVEGYGTGKPTTVDLAGIAANLKGVTFDQVSLDRFRLRGLMLADVIARARSGTGAWPHGQSYSLDVGKLSVAAGGKPFVSLASLTAGSDPKGTNQLETRMDMKDLVVMAAQGLTPGLLELGYDRFQGGMQMHAIVDRAAKQLRMDRLDIDAPAMGRLHLALGLDEVPYETIAPASGQANGMAALAMAQSRLQSVELTYDDSSLAGKAFAAAATKQNTTPAELKQTSIRALGMIGAQLNLSPAVLDPIIAFINDPRRLVVTMKPPQPVMLMQLSRVANDPQRGLGLAVSN